MKKTSKLTSIMLAGTMICLYALTACKSTEETKTLAEPQSITYADGTLAWSVVESATAYEVVVYQGTTSEIALEKQTVTETSVSVASLTIGNYTAGITATAEGYQSSNEKKYTFEVKAAPEKLATPDGFACENGQISWNAVSGAAGYTVKVTEKATGTAKIEKTVMAASISVADLEAGNYTLSVKANGVENVSLDSLAAAYDFTVAAKTVKLATPSGASVDVAARLVKWSAVENAQGYLVIAKKGSEKLFEKTVNTAEADISDVEESEFVLTIVAKGNGETTSDSDEYVYNVKINAQKLAAPSDISADSNGNTLSWKEVAGSDAYRLIVKKGDDTVIDEETIENSYDISSLGKGDYDVTLQTIAAEDDVFAADSDVAAYALTIASLGAYQAIENLRIDGGYLVWDENNARAYDVVVIERGNTTKLDVNGVTATDGKFMIAATGLASGNYTVSVTPADNRHDAEKGEAASYELTITEVRNYNAAQIATFDGAMPVGEHGKVELVTRNGKQVAKLTPTADGWGRIGSSSFTVNYDNNPVLYIDIEDIVIGGFHAQVQVDGNNLKVLDDGAKLADVALNLAEKTGLTGSKDTIIRLGVDNSSTTSANDAEAYYNGIRVMYITDYVAPFEGKLEKVTGFDIADGMTIGWKAVDHADSYRLTLKNKADNSVIKSSTQDGISMKAADLDAGEYILAVTAFNSMNDKALESDEATYAFKVTYLANYSAQDVSGFTSNLLGDSKTIGYDEATDTAVYNPDKTYGYGAIAPATGVSVNLTNKPFAVVDVAKVDHGYLIRGGWKEDGGNETTLVLRNDTVGALTDTKLYIELWKKADQNGAAVYGKGTYRFGMGFLAGGGNKGQVAVRSIKLVEITAIEDLQPGAKTPLAKPSGAKESKGEIIADSVKGNAAYTPKYSVTVTEKGGEQIYTATNLSAPSVMLAALDLVNGKTYRVAFKALGDDNYFVDSEEYVVEVTYTEILALTDFSNLDYTTMADKKGGSTKLTGANGSLTSTVANGNWGYDFFNIDVSAALEQLNADKDNIYLQWTIDLDKTTAGATLATRFYYPKNKDVVGTGWGDSTAQRAFLTKEWSDKITDDGVIWFALGQGGNSVDGAEQKVVVCSSFKFVKFALSEVNA